MRLNATPAAHAKDSISLIMHGPVLPADFDTVWTHRRCPTPQRWCTRGALGLLCIAVSGLEIRECVTRCSGAAASLLSDPPHNLHFAVGGLAQLDTCYTCCESSCCSLPQDKSNRSQKASLQMASMRRIERKLPTLPTQQSQSRAPQAPRAQGPAGSLSSNQTARGRD